MIPLVAGDRACWPGMREGSAQDRVDHLHLGPLHLDSGDRHGDHPDRHLRARARLAAGQIGDDQRASSWRQLVLPVLTLVLYDFGYVARMTRASMAEVMTSQYIRTAVLKGLPYRRVIMRHALRNALIAPFTVIVLQLNWLLSGVVVVEVFFQYEGFGKLLLDAALFGDIYVDPGGDPRRRARGRAVAAHLRRRLHASSTRASASAEERAMADAVAPPAASGRHARLAQPRAIVVLLLLMWLPLVAYVMFGRLLGDARTYVLLPAIPAALILYAHGVWRWRESWSPCSA